MNKVTLILSLKAIIFSGLLGIIFSTPTSASSFNAGRIIDDGVFTDKSTMSPSQIQDFLNAKVPTCDTWGTQPYAGTTRAEYAASRGVSTPFICLKDYAQDGKRASQIIYDVAQKYGINPQVLIVLLQKEQGLITDDWPWPIQYRSATGYGCPDTADCNAEYYGFTNQVDWAARMFRAILDNSPDWYTPYEVGNNYIQYNPDPGCGGSTVYIENRSTQALYNYTPYQPNQAALNAGWGTAPCGAYGNRNFHLYFTSWFGSTFVQFNTLDTPRWMQLSSSTQKINPWTGEVIGDTIGAGTQLKFVDKIYVNNQWYLRTAFDSANNSPKGVPQGNAVEIQAVPFDEPRYMMLKYDARKHNPRSIQPVSNTFFPMGMVIKFTDKFFVGGQWFYRTEFDSANQNTSAFFATSVSEIAFKPFDEPKPLTIKSGAKLVNLRTGNVVSTYNSSTDTGFREKLSVNGIWYYRTLADETAGNPYGISSYETADVSRHTIATPYTVETLTDTYKRSLVDGSPLSDQTLLSGQVVKVAKIIRINGVSYYQSEYDKDQSTQRGILVDETKIRTLSFVPLDSPRGMSLSSTIRKTNLLTGSLVGDELPAGTSLHFTSKTEVKGKWYLRTKFDTENSLPYGIAIENVNINN